MSKKSILGRFDKEDRLYTISQEVMTLEDYLSLVQKNPLVARSAYQRVYDMIISHGVEKSGKVGQEDLPRYKFFDDNFTENHEDAVYGIEDAQAKIVSFILAGALGLDAKKRFMLMLGPVASAKSTIARIIKKGLEEYTQSDEGAFYSFDWVKVPRDERELSHEITSDRASCPLHEDPLMLLPEHYRAEVVKELNKNLRDYPFKLRLDGELCPHCDHFYLRLMDQYDGDWQKILREHIEVKRIVASENRRVAIGTFKPADEKNQDSTELTGDEKLSTVGAYEDESHPLAFTHAGEIQLANRGVLEWVEILKLNPEFLYILLDGTQDRVIKGKNQPNTRIDQFFFGHTNVPEFDRLIVNDAMEALRDRITPIKVPYNLELSEEQRIYEKTYETGKVNKHIAPHTIHVAAMWAVLTRLEAPDDQKLTLMQKLLLYDGKQVGTWSRKDVKEMKEKTQSEGLQGVSPRLVQNLFTNLLTRPQYQGKCIDAHMLFSEIKDNVKWENASIKSPKDKERYINELLPLVEEAYKELAKTELMKAIAADETKIKRKFEKYIGHVRAFNQKKKVYDELTRREYEPDEDFMWSIEEKMDIDKKGVEDHRRALISFREEKLSQGQDFDFRANPMLLKALEEIVFEEESKKIDLSGIALPEESQIMSKEAREDLDKIKKRLKQDMGYCEECATGLLKFAGNLLQSP